MKSYQGVRKSESLLRKMLLLGLLAISAGPPAFQRTEAATNLVVWDAGSRFADTPDAQNRAGWKSVPSELFAFEADPPKAASDPGYYGREYSFKGDAVVENRNLTAVFSSATGRVILYAKADANSPGATGQSHGSSGYRRVEILPPHASVQHSRVS